MRLLIEKDDSVGVNVTTDTDEMSVEAAVFLLELAKMSVMSYYLSGASVPSDDIELETPEE